MRRTLNLYANPRLWGLAFARYLRSWWYMVHLGAVAIVLALSPSTYNRANRLAAARYIHAGTWQVLPWFGLASSLISLVIIRIVLVTAKSYGLSHFGLEMVVRVLVLELIPLSAAMFVALRASMAFDASALGLARAGMSPQAANDEALRRMRRDMVPQLLANAFGPDLSEAFADAARAGLIGPPPLVELRGSGTFDPTGRFFDLDADTDGDVDIRALLDGATPGAEGPLIA